ARDGVLVVRPDSGEPTEIVPAAIEALMDAFGHATTPTGYRLLPPQVRVIQGDGIDRFSTPKVMDAMIARGLAIGNIAFGMGGGLLQKPNRDDFSYALKVSAIEVDGAWRDVWKDPKTAGGAKTSKRGRVAVVRDGPHGALRHARLDQIAACDDLLTPVFENGEILRISTLDEIRARLWPR
ncbi:MAG: nicotinate phosphoribosyltransferase, partial [Rhodobacterales bacterium CG_4_10_14_0_8_um_filter_70_9]